MELRDVLLNAKRQTSWGDAPDPIAQDLLRSNNFAELQQCLSANNIALTGTLLGAGFGSLVLETSRRTALRLGIGEVLIRPCHDLVLPTIGIHQVGGIRVEEIPIVSPTVTKDDLNALRKILLEEGFHDVATSAELDLDNIGRMSNGSVVIVDPGVYSQTSLMLLAPEGHGSSTQKSMINGMQNDFNQNDPTTPSPRSIAQGFTKDHLRSLQRSNDVDAPTRERNAPLMEREVLRLCISNPDRLDELAAGRIDLKQYPSLAKHLIESPSAVNLDQSLAVLKKHGVNIGWPELKHGAKHLKTREYLILLKHGPELHGPNAADMLARCIANNESLAKDVISSHAVVNIRPRLLAAVSSMKPELASVKAEAVGQTKANPFFAPSKGPNLDRSF